MQRALPKALFIASLLASMLAVWLAPVASAGQLSGRNFAPAPPPTPGSFQTPSDLDGAEQAVINALQEAINSQKEAVPAYEIYTTQIDHLRVDSQQGWASAWLNPVDPQTGRVVPAEPGLALARYLDGAWQAILPGADGWEAALQAAPEAILPAAEKDAWLESAVKAKTGQTTTTFSGYRLPWETGKTIYLTQSVHHDAYTPSGTAHYAFDFAAPYDASQHGSPMFAVYAAKAGSVALAEWRKPNGNEQYPNYIVLKDTTTNPISYQLYLHLAQDTIPVELRQTGVQVQQGQYLGLADDTGQSSGNHLHFQVETNLLGYWGQSVDITFDDVAINGGRPRIKSDLPYCKPSDVCLTTQDTYISGNVTVGDRTPPRGDITSPAQDGINLTNSQVQVSGWAADDDPGLLSAQIVASYAGAWHDLGTPFSSSPFSLSWDLCASKVPDGPVSLALRMLDKNGNQITTYDGARHFFKSYACPAPPPACQPGASQVAIFAGTDFQGACSLLNSGDYPDGTSLGNVGDNQVNSIQVGSNVQATLYSEAGFNGRGETILANDANLADNRIGINTVSALKVQLRGSLAPPKLVFPAQGAGNDGQYVTLAWENGGGDLEYQAKWNNGSQTITSTWQADPAWSLGPLTAGSYQWQVRSRQGASQSAWSNPSSFSVTPGSTPPGNASPVNVPYTASMEINNWPHTNNWDLTTAQKHSGNTSYGYEPAGQSNYDTGVPNAGDLTSPPIQIPASGNYFLRFWYRSETEGSGVYWDKRQVLISADNGASYQELLQLADDPSDYWLQSPAIDLSAYKNTKVLVRFHFETVDARNNAYKGWYIDDFSITLQTQPACGDSNDGPGQATPLSYGNVVEGMICPAGDIDFYKFTGKAGDPVGIGVHALTTNGYTLDPYLFLLAEDGRSVLAENDDIVPLEQKDSFLTYRLPRDGTYFIKVKAWDHPSAGSPDARYQLSLGSDAQPPSIGLTQPIEGTYLPPSAFDLLATAKDAGSGINRVDFYWHDQDWSNPAWTYLGSDRDGTDGWQFKFNPQALPDQKNIAFYAQAVDNAGNSAFAGAYGTALDRTPPETTLQLANPVISSTAALLAWSGSDNLSGLDHYDVQMRQITGTTWSNWADLWAQVPASQGQNWFVGDLNRQYQFRVRGVDRLGNAEDYPASAQASFSIPANLCKADAFETDNDPAGATIVTTETIQVHNFCNPLPASNWKDDQDWLRLPMKAEQFLIIEAQPQSPSAAIVLELYGSQGSSGAMLAKSQPQVFGQATSLLWTASQDDTYTLRMRHPDGRVLGSDVQYQVKVRITNFAPLWLPVFMHLP
jgi:murein DD-endopeptidase MepM/ murein hydrolase activator NlpD